MRIASDSPLGFDGKTAVIHHLRDQLRRPLDESFVSFELDAVNATLTVHSLERSTTGEYGRYAGSETLSYQKIPLSACLPYSIPYYGEYPCSFAMLRGALEQQYGLVLEVGEFALAGTTTPLIDSSMLEAPLNGTTNVLRLEALASSARFTTGSVLNVMMIPNTGLLWLPGIVPDVLTLNGQLLTQTTPANRATTYEHNYFNSTPREIALELLWRSCGVRLDENSLDISLSSNHAQYVTVNLTARTQALDGSRSAYSGTTSYRYQKVALASIIPHDLVFDGAYPVAFDQLQEYLRYTYELEVESNQFVLEGGSNVPLTGSTLISIAPDGQGEIVLVATNASLKWTAGSRLRLRLLPNT